MIGKTMWPLFALLFIAVHAAPASCNLSVPVYFDRILNSSSYVATDIFVVPFNIGNPPGRFNLTLDFSYSETVVIGSSSLSDTCGDSQRRAFDTSRSTTFRWNQSNLYDVSLFNYMTGRQCGISLDAKAIYGSDDFAGVRQVPFGVISQFKGAWNPDWGSDGILGLLGPNLIDEIPVSTAKYLAQKFSGDAVNAAILSFKLNGQRIRGQQVGSIVLGGVAEGCGTVKYPEPYYPSSSNQPWNFRVDSASLGSVKADNIGAKGFVAPIFGSNLLTLPKDTFLQFMAEISATLDKNTGKYFVDCAAAPTLPVLYVRALGAQFHFASDNYVDVNNPNSGKCEVLLNGLGEGMWTFGNRLWQSYCVVLDYGNSRVGFAEI